MSCVCVNSRGGSRGGRRGLEPRPDLQDEGFKVLRQLSAVILPGAIHQKMFLDYK